jgi:predicted MPP superfamily phosphohydrolase
LKAWPILGILIVQAVLCLAHWFLYFTCISFFQPLSAASASTFKIALISLSFLFMAAALLGFRFTNWVVALFYQIAAIWLGLLNFLFVGACLAWAIDGALRLAAPDPVRLHARPEIAMLLVAGAAGVVIYGILNAKVIRIRRVPVTLERLPDSWRGRTALLLSDIHLGNINGVRFARRLTSLAQGFNPDVIFIPGDLFDGTKADPAKIAAPFFELTPPLGVFFASGNHEEHGGSTHYSDALKEAGFRVLDSECVTVDGLRVLGVPYEISNYPMRLRQFLTGFRLNDGPASILLQHVPTRLPIVEQAGVSLQLSGHTHGGQVFPFSWITRRAFGKFTYGLQRFGALQVITSSGVGTWGPPMRVGTHPELVLITFQ